MECSMSLIKELRTRQHVGMFRFKRADGKVIGHPAKAEMDPLVIRAFDYGLLRKEVRDAPHHRLKPIGQIVDCSGHGYSLSEGCQRIVCTEAIAFTLHGEARTEWHAQTVFRIAVQSRAARETYSNNLSVVGVFRILAIPVRCPCQKLDLGGPLA
jgi:hypothetical protein